MGFIVIFDYEKEEVSVTLDGKVVSLFPRPGLRECLESQRVFEGGDTLEAYAERLIYHEDDIAMMEKDDNDVTQGQTNDDGTKKKRNHKGKKVTKTRRQRKSGNKGETKKETGGDATKLVVDSDDKQPATQENALSKTVDLMKHAVVDVSWQSYHNTTIEELNWKFEILRLIFETTHLGFKGWESGLMALKKSSKFSITNIVALGLGSHHPAYQGVPRNEIDSTMPYRTGYILAVVMMIREVFGEENQPLPCVIQDICYSGVDKYFLKTLDFTVVDDPDALGLINANTLVFHIGTYVRVAWWICAGTWPAAIITEKYWANPTGSLLGSSLPSYVVPGLKEMYTHYEVDKEVKENVFFEPRIVNIYTIKDTEGSSSAGKAEVELAQSLSELDV
ncbi:hypothetical protein IFR05_011796 [Cadophora sp. M221]|nr:hypothetical protein IFR05_011796 [Cadophora sp. M221]